MLVLGNHLWFTLSTLCLSSTRADSCGPKSSSTRQQPIPTTQENQVLFFLKRLFLMDPVFSIAALAAIPALWRTYRRRESEATVFFAGLAVVFASAFLRSYRNVTCLAPAIPALAILVARAIPPRIAFPIATVALAVKLAVPAQAWTLDLRPAVLHLSVTLLETTPANCVTAS